MRRWRFFASLGIIVGLCAALQAADAQVVVLPSLNISVWGHYQRGTVTMSAPQLPDEISAWGADHETLNAKAASTRYETSARVINLIEGSGSSHGSAKEEKTPTALAYRSNVMRSPEPLVLRSDLQPTAQVFKSGAVATPAEGSLPSQWAAVSPPLTTASLQGSMLAGVSAARRLAQAPGSENAEDDGDYQAVESLSADDLVWFTLAAWVIGSIYDRASTSNMPSSPVTAVPEPSSLAALGMGFAGLIGTAFPWKRRSRRAVTTSQQADN